MARSHRWKNKPEAVRAAGREARMERRLEKITVHVAPKDFVYTLGAQARALRTIENGLGKGRS